MTPTRLIVLWWLAFGGAHLLLSNLSVRTPLVATLGERLFQALYSLIVLALFVPLVSAYFMHKHDGAVLWALPPNAVIRWAMYVGIGIAFVLVVGSQVTPSPTNLVPGEARVRGVLHITRHPFVMGTVLWALCHLVLNGTTTAVAFFGGFVVFGIVGAWHQDRRKLATNLPGYREFCAAAPFFPFARPGALPGLRELTPAVAIGTAATIVVRYFHASWFGG